MLVALCLFLQRMLGFSRQHMDGRQHRIRLRRGITFASLHQGTLQLVRSQQAIAGAHIAPTCHTEKGIHQMALDGPLALLRTPAPRLLGQTAER